MLHFRAVSCREVHCVQLAGYHDGEVPPFEAPQKAGAFPIENVALAPTNALAEAPEDILAVSEAADAPIDDSQSPSVAPGSQSVLLHSDPDQDQEPQSAAMPPHGSYAAAVRAVAFTTVVGYVADMLEWG